LRLRNSFLVALLLLAGCSRKPAETSVFIDPQFASLVPPDATLLVGTRVEHLVKTPLYKYYLAGKIQSIDKFATGTGISVEKSLWNVMFVSNGRQSFLLGRGKFADELMAPDLSRPGVQRFSYKGLILFGDEREALMFINSSTAAIGETAVLRSLVDQRPAMRGPPARITALMKEIPREAHFWGVYTGGPIDLPLTGNMANANKMLGMVDSGDFYFDLSKGVNGLATTNSAGANRAQQIEDALQGLIGLAKMAAPKNQALFDTLRVNRVDSRISVAVDAPPELLDFVLK
jgi:hypothetical protein